MKIKKNLPEANANTEMNQGQESMSTDINAKKQDKKIKGKEKKAKKKRKKLPRPVKIGIICGIIGVVVFFIVYALIKVRDQHSKAFVEPVSDLSMGYYGGGQTFDGTITDEDAQTIPVDSAKTIAEVFVHEGEEVKKGTPLLSYDENEAKLQLESDQESLSDSKQKLEMEQKLLDYYNNLTPIADPLSKDEQKKQDEIDKKTDEQYEKDLEKNYPPLQISEDDSIYTTELDTDSINLQAGKSYKVNVKAASSESTVVDSAAGAWYTDEKTTATVEDGLITAQSGKTGKVSISAEGFSDPVNVNITESVPALCAVKLDKYRLDIFYGGSGKIVPTAYAGSTTPVPEKADDGSGSKAASPDGVGEAIKNGVTYTFSSSDDTIAEVSKDGTVTSKAEGTAIITVTASYNGMTASTHAAVVIKFGIPNLASVELSESTLNLDLSDPRKSYKHIGAKINPSNARIEKIEWKSSDEKTVTCEDGYITGIKEGTATVTLTVNDKTATCLVTVVNGAKGEILTVSEKAEKIKEINSNIKSINQEIKSIEATIKSDKQAITDLTVTSLVDGIVKIVSDPDNPPNDGSPFLSIGSESGVSVSFYVDEFTYPDIKTGDKFTVTNYMNGQASDAVVTMISDYPSEDYQGYGGSVALSYYKVTAFLENGDGFNVDDSVSVAKAMDENMDGTSGPIIIQKLYVRRDSKGSYVMIDDGSGHLKRQEVTTKKTQDSDSIEILSGLTNDDLIAFPYGETAKEGNITTTDYPSNIFGF